MTIRSSISYMSNEIKCFILNNSFFDKSSEVSTSILIFEWNNNTLKIIDNKT